MLDFLKALFDQRSVLRTLVYRDFSSRFLSSYIGLPWAFIQPISYVFVMWFAITYGLRGGEAVPGIPLGAWLLVAMVPWMFMSQTIIVGCMALPEYAYLIKKTSFNVAIIPLIKVFSGMVVHLALVGLIVVVLVLGYGYKPTVYWLQLPYYLFATLVFLSGIRWFVASVNVFIHDMAHIVNIAVSILFWATPIFWPFSMLEGNMRYIALLNPFFYITEGYRYTFLENVWFFEYAEMNLYFWGVTGLLLMLGVRTFKKLRPDFGDVL